jgi:hypothetical protein
MCDSVKNCSNLYHIIPRRIHCITGECSGGLNQTGDISYEILLQNIPGPYSEIKLHQSSSDDHRSEVGLSPLSAWSQIRLLEHTMKIWMATGVA